MLSELAIDNKEAFSELVKVATAALNGKKVVTAVKKEEKKAVKKEETNEKKDSSDLSGKTLTELKALAKEKGVKGFSTMKKDELLKALN